MNSLPDPNSTLEQCLLQNKKLLLDVWQAMRLRLVDTGLEDCLSVLPGPDNAGYSIREDPFDGCKTLVGTWRDGHGDITGEIQIRSDGAVYAEVDVIRSHPVDARWFVEAVTAWGKAGSLKTELKLLSAL